MAVCASCVFGAVSTRLLSFSYSAIHTWTVSLIPHVTIYQNGVQVTNYDTTTQPITEIIGSGVSQTAVETFTNINNITWTVEDATLTWPTTYVQYLGFRGAPMTSSESCVQAAEATPVSLPSNTDPASFIYPLGADGIPLPTPLLDYLDGLDSVASQFDGIALSGCAPLDSSDLERRHEFEHERRRFEGARLHRPLAARTASNALVHANNTSSSVPTSSSSSLSTPTSDGISSSSLAGITSLPSASNPSNTPSSSGSELPSTSASPLLATSPSIMPPISSSMPISNSVSLEPNSNGTVPTTPYITVITSTVRPNCTHTLSGFPLLSNKCEPRVYTTTITSTITPTPAGSSGIVPGKGTSPPGVESTGTVNGPPAPYGHTSAFGLTTITMPGKTTHIQGDPPKPTTKVSANNHGDHPTGNGGGSPTGNGPSPMHTPGDGPNNSPGGNTPSNAHHSPSPQGGNQHTTQDSNNKPNTAGQLPAFTIHGSKFSEQTNGVVINHHTVRPGQKITIGSGASKTTLALQTKGGTTHLVVDGTTYNAGKPGSGSGATPAPSAVITANGHTITAVESGNSIVLGDGQHKTTIPIGSTATFDGVTVSVPKPGSSIVVDGTTYPVTATGEGSSPSASSSLVVPANNSGSARFGPTSWAVEGSCVIILALVSFLAIL